MQSLESSLAQWLEHINLMLGSKLRLRMLSRQQILPVPSFGTIETVMEHLLQMQLFKIQHVRFLLTK